MEGIGELGDSLATAGSKKVGCETGILKNARQDADKTYMNKEFKVNLMKALAKGCPRSVATERRRRALRDLLLWKAAYGSAKE